MAVWNTVNLTEIKPDRFDAEYFRKDYQDNLSYLNKTGGTYNLGRLFNHINRGSQPSYAIDGTIKALRSVNVGFMNFNETRQEYVTDSFFEANNRGQVQRDDVLITSTGVGTLGRTSVWFYNDKAYCDGHITILRNGSVDPYFITAFLNSKYGLLQFDQNYRGSSGQIEIYPYDISKFVIPECLFPYQQETGDYLRKAFELQQESQSLYQKATELLETELGLDKITFEKPKSYTASFSEVACTRRLDSNHFQPQFKQLINHLQANFECKKIGYITSLNSRGVQPTYVENGESLVINSKHLSATHIKYDILERTSKGEFEANSKAHIFKGDILIYTTGAYVGLTNVYLGEEKALASNHVNILRLNDYSIDTTYLALVLNTTIGKLQTSQHIRGSAQAELYPNDIAKFIVPIISEDKMEAIGNLVRSSLENSQSAKILLKKAKNRVEEIIEEAAKK